MTLLVHYIIRRIILIYSYYVTFINFITVTSISVTINVMIIIIIVIIIMSLLLLPLFTITYFFISSLLSLCFLLLFCIYSHNQTFSPYCSYPYFSNSIIYWSFYMQLHRQKYHRILSFYLDIIIITCTIFAYWFHFLLKKWQLFLFSLFLLAILLLQSLSSLKWSLILPPSGADAAFQRGQSKID